MDGTPINQLETRTARPDDAAATRELLKQAHRTSLRVWWWREYLGQDVFQLCLIDGRLVGALLADVDVGPVAWVLLAALSDDADLGRWLGRSLSPLKIALRRRGGRRLAWMNDERWDGAKLNARGFRQTSRIVNLLKDDRHVPAVAAPGVRVRDAEMEDVEEVAQIDRAAFTPPWWFSVRTLERMRRAPGCFLIAERMEGCVGYVSGRLVGEGHAHIDRLGVAPRFQGQGVGGRLLSAALNRLWDQGVQRVTLNTQESNRTSQRLYFRFGFRSFGDDVLVWERAL